MTERTLIIVKPDAVQANNTQTILETLQERGLKILASGQIRLSRPQAAGFYAEHRGKPFYDELVEFMTSGPCVVGVLEAEGAIGLVRDIIGNTNPSLAAEGTIRRRFGSSTTRNTIHASDSPQSAQREIAFLFPDLLLPVPAESERLAAG